MVTQREKMDAKSWLFSILVVWWFAAQLLNEKWGNAGRFLHCGTAASLTAVH
jgi:hypothetical protein